MIAILTSSLAAGAPLAPPFAEVRRSAEATEGPVDGRPAGDAPLPASTARLDLLLGPSLGIEGSAEPPGSAVGVSASMFTGLMGGWHVGIHTPPPTRTGFSLAGYGRLVSFMHPLHDREDFEGLRIPYSWTPNALALGCRFTFSSSEAYLTISPGLATPLYPPFLTDLNSYLYGAAMCQLMGVAPPFLEYGWTIAPGKTFILRSAFQLLGLRLSF